MILLTGSGYLASEFQRQFSASEIVSIRHYLYKAPDVLKKKIRKAKAIIHNSGCLASGDPAEIIKSNLTNTEKLISIVSNVNPGIPFINISSMSILEKETKTFHPAQMPSVYARTKAQAEKLCLSKLPNCTSVRFSTLFYRDPTKDALSKMVFDAFHTGKIELIGWGNARRDWMPLRIAVQYLKLMADWGEPRRVVNIASGEALNFKDLAVLARSCIPNTVTAHTRKEEKEALHQFTSKTMPSRFHLGFDLRNEIQQYVEELQCRK